jgi:hypothetical protein
MSSLVAVAPMPPVPSALNSYQHLTPCFSVESMLAHHKSRAAPQQPSAFACFLPGMELFSSVQATGKVFQE